MNTLLAGIIRTALATAAGFVAAKGWIGADEVQSIVGAVMVLVTAAWSAKDKSAAKARESAALNSAPDGMRLVSEAKFKSDRAYTSGAEG